MIVLHFEEITAVAYILVASLVCGLLLAVGHWFPWEKWLRKPLPRIPSYVYGLASVLAPVSVVLMITQNWFEFILIWSCAVIGGGTVVLCYGVDNVLHMSNKSDLAAEETEVLRGQIFQED